jgi:hypothetical protein
VSDVIVRAISFLLFVPLVHFVLKVMIHDFLAHDYNLQFNVFHIIFTDELKSTAPKEWRMKCLGNISGIQNMPHFRG